MRRVIRNIERISGDYGLKLKKDKCGNLNMNTEEQQTFKAGQKLLAAEEGTYLGKTLNRKENAAQEVEKQMQQTNITMWKLNQYWKATEASNKWQLLIFDAVIKSKLLYGMETLQLTEALSNKIDAFQIKGFRNM